MAFHQMSHLGNRPFAALGAGVVAALVGAHPAVLAGLLLTPIGLLATRVRGGSCPTRTAVRRRRSMPRGRPGLIDPAALTERVSRLMPPGREG